MEIHIEKKELQQNSDAVPAGTTMQHLTPQTESLVTIVYVIAWVIKSGSTLWRYEMLVPAKV
jgi:hypothetical protein